MGFRLIVRCALIIVVSAYAPFSQSHPLRLSLSEIEYFADRQLVSISLRLFLMDVNEALVFDPDSNELRFCEPDESPLAEPLLISYLNDYFYVEANGSRLPLVIKSKKIKGEGIDAALALTFEHKQPEPVFSLGIKNAVFTDLFFDQNNIVYVHVNGQSTSLMLNKKTPTHRLAF